MVIEERGNSIFFDVKEDHPDYDDDSLEVPSFFKKEDDPPEGIKDVQGK